MGRTPSGTRYGALTQVFHWLTVLLVGAAWLLSEGGRESRVGTAQGTSILTLHETFGVLVLLILILRVVWRLFDRVPEEPPMPAWMALSSRVVHWALYALLAAVPLTAIVGAWLEGHPINVIGIGNIGSFLGTSPALGRSIAEIHSVLGDAIIWIAGLHAAAALFHHFVLRDRVLLSMLPGRPTPS